MNEPAMDCGNYREIHESIRGLATYEQAWALRELLLHVFEQRRLAEDYLFRVEERPNGLFDMIVLKCVN